MESNENERMMSPEQIRIVALAMYYLGIMEGYRDYISVKEFAGKVAPDLQKEFMTCVADILHAELQNEQGATAEIRTPIINVLANDVNRFIGRSSAK